MATKKTTTTKTSSTTSWNKIAGICAFFAVVIAGVIFAINGIVSLVGASFSAGGVLNTIATVLLVAAVVIPGWRFVRGQKMWVQILFWVCVLVLVIFGAISFNM